MTDRRPDAVDQLLVQADLTITVDGVDARLTGDGSRLRLETDNPVALLRRMAAVGTAVPGGRRTLAEAVDAVTERGLTVVATGPRGPALHVGAGVSSSLGRRLTGTPNVRLVVPRTQRLGLLAAAVVVVTWWAVGRRRRHDR